MKTQVSNSKGLSVMPAFFAKYRRKLSTTGWGTLCTSLPKGLAIVFTAVLLSACANEVDKGVCGANPTYCSWSYNDKKELTIIGTGEMIKDAADLPRGAHYGWDKYRKEMTAVSISGVTAIGSEAFRGCIGITKITIPNSVTKIGDFAFYDTGITEINIGSGLDIMSNSWIMRDNLTTVNVNKKNAKYSSVDGVVFDKGKNVLFVYPAGRQGTYIIPDDVTKIDEAFFVCKGLTSVSIPSSVTGIGKYAFYGCTGLTSVYNYSTTPQNIENSVFYDVNLANATLYVPASSESTYRVAPVWKKFGQILAIP